MTSNEPTLSPVSRVLATLSTLGMLLIVYYFLAKGLSAAWWEWTLAIALFVVPAGLIVVVERPGRDRPC